jgi:hypothetical protein
MANALAWFENKIQDPPESFPGQGDRAESLEELKSAVAEKDQTTINAWCNKFFNDSWRKRFVLAMNQQRRRDRQADHKQMTITPELNARLNTYAGADPTEKLNTVLNVADGERFDAFSSFLDLVQVPIESKLGQLPDPYRQLIVAHDSKIAAKDMEDVILADKSSSTRKKSKSL